MSLTVDRPRRLSAIQASTNLGIIEESRSNQARIYTGLDSGPYRIGSVPQRFRSRPPLAIAITTRISSQSALATDTVMVLKLRGMTNDQVSSLWPNGQMGLMIRALGAPSGQAPESYRASAAG
jgi:hypothetical protein